ncbi:hypothetical protein FFWV33_16705 [Flavobacterium faecale]|uniref:Acyltransferase 3 domain-containing protein n=1 Tax=Flavobacterium faecale TaxID=1355330 RepID=A0A2S1LHT4_9FLAO|nr:acyltransferase [Flavobacterium faecale]AWG23046.1 hypothetical protein FFWV33_16705 [Flavobacterium faecale]
MNISNKFDISLSQKLKVLSFILMIFVVFIHSYNLGYSTTNQLNSINSQVNHFIQNFISQGINRVAVPLFFFISSILYFYKFDLSLSTYRKKVQRRVVTLLIPYIVWSLIGIFLYLILQVNPLTSRYFSDNNQLIVNYSLIKILDTIFIDPIPFQLWFIRDLFILVLVSPVIELLNKYSKGYWLIILFIAWLYPLSIIIVKTGSLLFFSFGAFIVKNRFELLLKKVPFRLVFISSIIWILFNILYAINYLHHSNYIFAMINKIFIIIGVFSIWSIYDYIRNKNLLTLSDSILKTTFFLFVMHEPFLTFLRKLMLVLVGKNEIQLLMIYFLSAITVIITSICVGLLFKKYLKKIYFILTGGR